jgi:UDP-N-acetylglucosamine 2-epimerase (non-hydrolysing)
MANLRKMAKILKILTILGTRPEIIRLSRIIESLDDVCDHTLVHTGQNYDPNLNEIFFQQMGIRQPDIFFDAKGSFGQQIATILARSEEIMLSEKPDRFLVLGDTNSALSAFVAKRLGIRVYHMEAGNRCFDDRVPEEVNRRVVDHSSDILLPYTQNSRQNLLNEGISGRRIYVTGNPILEVIQHHSNQIAASEVFRILSIQPGEYFLVTLHRAENVNSEQRLLQVAQALEQLQLRYRFPIIVSTHPHTRNKLQAFGISLQNPQIRFLEPFGFFDFVALEQKAFCVLSDSGTVPEECALFKVANVILRDSIERPELLECGSCILTGVDPEQILTSVAIALSKPFNWIPPAEYLATNVSQTVIRILMGQIGI